MPDLLLGLVLLAFIAVDVALRRIPMLVILAGSAVVIVGHYGFDLWPWSGWGLLAIWTPFLLFFAAGFPGGDVKALPILGAMLGWPGALWMTAILLGLTWTIMLTVGRRRSLIGLPWMPVVAVVVIVVRVLTR